MLVVEIDSYDEVPELLRQIERRIASRQIWVSGSWPAESGPEIAKVYAVAQKIGEMVGASGRNLVTGAGVVVGSASIAGFLDALRSNGGWDLDQRLIARPFPQPIPGSPPDEEQWKALRCELARLAGVVIVVGGAKIDGGNPVTAAGVIDECDAALAAGSFILPIGCTGGAASEIANSFISSELPSSGRDALRPTDEELSKLADPAMTVPDIVTLVSEILTRLDKKA